MPVFYIKIEPKTIHVQDETLFRTQGGPYQPWGKEWRKIEAVNLEAARREGVRLRDLENDAAAS